MKVLRVVCFLLACCSAFVFQPNLRADPWQWQLTGSDAWTSARPDGHAPFGVMGDHMHHAGEWMLGYHFMGQRWEDLLNGSQSISPTAVLGAISPNGEPYTMAPTTMNMYMHMFEVMAAPTDYLTFMVMGNYMQMDMDMVMDMGEHDLMTMSHSVNGWSDTSATAMIRLFNQHHQAAHIQLGVGIPTGSVDEKNAEGEFLGYDMQLGTGTWNFLPGITYLGQTSYFSWGGQYTALIPLERKNDSGYRIGDTHQLTAWIAVPFCEWASISGRIAYQTQSRIHGHFNGPHEHSSTTDFPQNYGGETLTIGPGLNFRVPHGFFKNHRLAVEAQLPIYQDLNGIQLKSDWTVFTGWQWSF